MFFIKCIMVAFSALLLNLLQKVYAANHGGITTAIDGTMSSPDPMSLILIGLGVLGIGLVGWWGRGN
jgi:hypothetical protein